MMRAISIGVLTAWTGVAAAQWDVPVRVELTNADPDARQVTGLADPSALDAGVSVDAARAQSMSFATASGTTALVADLSPAPTAYTAGMLITLVPASANESGATLDLNSLGARPIVKGAGLLLDSADLSPGAPARFLFDGERFVLVSSALRACRTGYSAVSATLCVEDSSRAPLTFSNANLACAAIGARLCKFGEWISACRKAPGFMGTVPEAEWVDSAGNFDSNAKVVGVGNDGHTTTPGSGCNYGGHDGPTLSHRYRCCTNR
jgi:hypothetical protein